MDRLETVTASEALAAISRLLGIAVEGEEPAALGHALVAEAQRFFSASESVLLEVDTSRRTLRPAASSANSGVLVDTLEFAELTSALQAADGDLRVGYAAGAEARAVARALGAATEARSILSLPLEARGEVTHLLLLVDACDGPPSGDELATATAFAAAARAALAYLKLVEEREAQVAEHTVLAQAAKVVNKSPDLGQLLTRICREAAGLLDAERAAVWRGNADTGIVVEAVFGFPPELIGHRLEPGEGLPGRVVDRDEPLLEAGDSRTDTDFRDGSPLQAVRSGLGVPLRWDGELRGVLNVGFTGSRPVGEEQLALLETFAELASAACGNASAHARLVVAARTDPLTGCLNQGAMRQELQREVQRSERTGQPLALVLIDLDDFKQVNEKHGHPAGDEVLARVGAALRSSMRPYDVVARYGGDEFALLTLDTGEEGASEIARRAIERLRAIRAVGEAPGAAGASAGVAQWTAGLSPTELLAEADRALLFGKQEQGRGSVVACSELPDDFRPERFSRHEPLPPALPAWPTARQSDRLRRRTRQLVLANALGARLAEMTDVEGIVTATVDELTRAFGYFLCAVLRIDDDGYVRAAAGRGAAFHRLEGGYSQPLEAGVIGRALRERRPVIVDDASRDPDYRSTAQTERVRSELSVPVWVGEELWGALDIQEVEPGAFDEDDARLAQTVADQLGSALRSALLYERLERAYLGTAEALAAALEAKDSYTAGHSRAIVEYTQGVGRRLGLDESSLRTLRYGAVFHDIGKLAVPEAVLNKREPLSPEERALIERHTVVGEQILAPIDFLRDVLPLVRHEHERWDGRGYPDGLAEDEIPLGSRIILACDAYHAMTSDRPYRAAMSEEEARAELERYAGRQFDARVVSALLEELEGGRPVSV